MSGKKYEGPFGEALTADEFVEQAMAMPGAHRYAERGAAYRNAASAFYMKQGSNKLKRQLLQYSAGQRRTVEPDQLRELSRLGETFDIRWYNTN